MVDKDANAIILKMAQATKAAAPVKKQALKHKPVVEKQPAGGKRVKLKVKTKPPPQRSPNSKMGAVKLEVSDDESEDIDAVNVKVNRKEILGNHENVTYHHLSGSDGDIETEELVKSLRASIKSKSCFIVCSCKHADLPVHVSLKK